MKRYIIIAIFTFLTISFASAQSQIKSISKLKVIDISRSLPTFYVYGELMPSNYVDEKDSVLTMQYGFKIKRVAGCVISKEKVDEAHKHNQKADKIMRKKLGEDWDDKFEKATGKKLALQL